MENDVSMKNTDHSISNSCFFLKACDKDIYLIRVACAVVYSMTVSVKIHNLNDAEICFLLAPVHKYSHAVES